MINNFITSLKSPVRFPFHNRPLATSWAWHFFFKIFTKLNPFSTANAFTNYTSPRKTFYARWGRISLMFFKVLNYFLCYKSLSLFSALGWNINIFFRFHDTIAVKITFNLRAYKKGWRFNMDAIILSSWRTICPHTQQYVYNGVQFILKNMY